MPEDKKNRFKGLLGLDPTLGVGGKLLDYVEEAHEKEKTLNSDYYAFCPKCGKRQVKVSLIENGCFLCGWKGKEEEIEKAKPGNVEGTSGYKSICPNCDASVITEEFLENGCWKCGYKK
jgi:hypothetical protein